MMKGNNGLTEKRNFMRSRSRGSALLAVLICTMLAAASLGGGFAYGAERETAGGAGKQIDSRTSEKVEAEQPQQEIAQPDVTGAALKNETVPVLMYHHFVEGKEATGVTMTRERFKEEMEYVRDNDYTPLLPADLSAIKAGEMEMPEKPVMITIDDGYESNYKIAYPVLKETGMKATIFVITKNMNKNTAYYEIPKLDWEQMREMYDSGFVDIQSHTFNLHNASTLGKHLKLSSNGIQRGLVESRAQYEWRIGEDLAQSIERIEKNVGNKVTCLAYPYGAYDPWIDKALVDNGIEFGFVVEDAPANLKGAPYHMNRYYIDMKTDIEAILEGKV